MNIETETKKRFDLEERTFKFARSVIDFVDTLPKTIINNELVKQVIRSSGSVGANYIEANESISKKDYTFRVKVCRKEAKESGYWLKLVEMNKGDLHKESEVLLQESVELMKIFGAIVSKSQ